MIKVLIVDDHTIVREGLKFILAQAQDIIVAGEAQAGKEALTKLNKERYDVILLDISMPGETGLELLKRIKALYPDQKILILSMYPEDQYAVRTLRGGASGYLTKETAGEELIRAVRKVAGGGKYISTSLGERLAFLVEDEIKVPRHERLSDREFEILCLIASGMTVGEIARKLSLSVSTVSTYRSRILEKMHMHTNAELTYYAFKNSLVT
jgi:two-component system invasion response regulator UvrY